MNTRKTSDNNRIMKGNFYVKYMLCLRDKNIVKSVLDDQALNYRISDHGAIELLQGITKSQHQNLRMSLLRSGMYLLNQKESMLIDRIINLIVDEIHNEDILPDLTFSDIITQQRSLGEKSILKIFSDVKGVSVLQFIVIQKVERVKELLLYENRSLSEIAKFLNYKNKNFLIAQFKKITGLTPDYFKRLRKERIEVSKHQLGTSELTN